MNRIRHLLLIAVAVLLFSASSALAQLRGQLVASGLSAPVGFVQDPSRPDVQLIFEQGGRIRVLQSGTLLATDFLDLTNDVLSGGEQGLLGVAFSPDYATSRRLYVNFTNRAGDTVVARFLRSATDPLRADPATRFDLVWPDGRAFIDQPFSNHNGGNMMFGPDGFLYIGLGDGGSGNDPDHRAQDPSTLLGKMLRIDVSVSLTQARGYVVPASNPFVGQVGVLGEIWAFGYRNPWRFSFDDPSRGGTGALIVGDVGQSAWEEIDYEPAGRGGRNYGWRNREGAHDNVTSLPPFSQPLTDPILEYGRSVGQAVTGGFVYRGSALGGAYFGRYFFADIVSSRVWSLGLSVSSSTGEATVASLTEHTAELGGAAAAISSFGVDANGELYAVNYGGGIHRIALGSSSDGSCASPSPGSGWSCFNGGWLPPGMPIPGITPPPTPPSPPPPSSTNCTTAAPGPDWTCFNGGWLPPGMPIPGDSTPPPPPTTPPVLPPPTGCSTAAPGPDWTCFNGGWLPPGMPIPGGTPVPPPPPPSTGCTTPDPFVGIPGLIGVCVNGGWVPVAR